MKKPKIGVKVLEILDFIRQNLPYDTIEAQGRDPKFSFNKKILDIVKKESKNLSVSLHSQTKRVFENSKDKLFTEGEMMALKTEILMCKYAGVEQLIFHLKNEKLSKYEEKLFKDLEKFAEKAGIEILYEINGEFIGESTLDFLKRFPKINMNLDLGHLNFAVGTNTIGMDLDNFISKVKDRVVYIHAHNNNGLKDEHKALDEGTLDWKHVLDMLDLTKIKKIIMEINSIEGTLRSKKLLEEYIETRLK
jgi:sugar phosphate isomerase/epimerase